MSLCIVVVVPEDFFFFYQSWFLSLAVKDTV